MLVDHPPQDVNGQTEREEVAVRGATETPRDRFVVMLEALRCRNVSYETFLEAVQSAPMMEAAHAFIQERQLLAIYPVAPPSGFFLIPLMRG
jgi:hypothetical protein